MSAARTQEPARMPLQALAEGLGRWRLWVDRELKPLPAAGRAGPSSPVPGLALHAGHVSPERAPDQPRLRRAVHAALDRGQGAWLSLARAQGLPLMLAVDAEPARAGSAACACIRLCDPHRFEPDRQALQSMFGLTAAEAEVAARLAAGWHPPQIAVALGIQANTVAAHLKRALAKTGAGRQAALVALLRGCATCGKAP